MKNVITLCLQNISLSTALRSLQGYSTTDLISKGMSTLTICKPMDVIQIYKSKRNYKDVCIDRYRSE